MDFPRAKTQELNKLFKLSPYNHVKSDFLVFGIGNRGNTGNDVHRLFEKTFTQAEKLLCSEVSQLDDVNVQWAGNATMRQNKNFQQ